MVTEVKTKMFDWNLSKYRLKTASIHILYFVVLNFRSLDMVKPSVSFKDIINGRFLFYSTASVCLSLQRYWRFAAIQVF